MLARIPKVSKNACFKLISYYVPHRAYLTPGCINKYFHLADAACPRCGEAGVELLHMLWSCPSLKNVWKESTRIADAVIVKEVPASPGHCLLSYFPHTSKTKVTIDFKI